MKSMKNQYCLDKFFDHFDLLPARTPSLVVQAYSVRHQVYCVETGFEDAKKYSSPLESDDFDQRSVHSLIRLRRSGLMVGTVRLVLPCPYRSDATLPMEAHCGKVVDYHAKHGHVPRSSLAEISRFAISKLAKLRIIHNTKHVANDTDRPTNRKHETLCLQSEAKMLQMIIFGLYAAIVKMSVDHKITHLCAIMEPALLRMASCHGIFFKPVAPLVNHHGLRQPGMTTLEEFLMGIRRKRPELWQFIVAYAYQGQEAVAARG